MPTCCVSYRKSGQNGKAKEKLTPRYKYLTDYHDIWQEVVTITIDVLNNKL